MRTHPWLPPSPALVSSVSRARVTALLRELPSVPANRLGARAAAWPPLLAALPELLRIDAGRALAAVGRVDVLAVLLDLTKGSVDADRLERALVTLWLGLAGHPGLTSPLALPGPFRVCVVDPGAPRLLALGAVRGLAATTRGAVVLGHAGRQPVEAFTVATLPTDDGTVIVAEPFTAPDPQVVANVRTALSLVRAALPGARVERVTIGAGVASPNAATYGEARVGADADPADLVASAQAAFVRAACADETVVARAGALVEKGQRLSAVDVLARACGNAIALRFRSDRAGAAAAVGEDLEDLAVLAEFTPTGTELMAAVRAHTDTVSDQHRRALLVNIDADDFVYSFQFGRSVERRCRERDLRVDRIEINPGSRGDLAAELGRPLAAPLVDGVEILVDSDQDSSLTAALQRLSGRPYEVVVLNVRATLFYDLLAAGLLAAATLVWDRHLHGGLRAERERRGSAATDVGGLPMQAWSLDRTTGPGIQESLAAAGFEHGRGHVWPMDLEFFQSSSARHPSRLFAGGENQRDWPLFMEAIRDLPLDVHVVAANVPAAAAELPPRVHLDARLPLWRFRDAMASAEIAAVPLVANAAAGVTVIPMAMALGVAVVATRTPWTQPLVTDGEDGLLVPAGDVGAFRAAILRLHEQPELRARLVANARRRVAELCDLEAFTREMFATLG